METMRIRFKPEEGGHEGLINACDFDPARHERAEAVAEAAAPKPPKAEKSAKASKGEK